MTKEQYQVLLNLCDDVEKLERENFVLSNWNKREKLGVKNLEKYQKKVDVPYYTSEIHSETFPKLIWDFTDSERSTFFRKLLIREKNLTSENNILKIQLSKY